MDKLKDYETKIIDSILSGSGVDEDMIRRYNNYVLTLSYNYYYKQTSIFNDMERKAMKKSTDKYLARTPQNPHYIWGADLGGCLRQRI